jgi:hypothetical protein
LIEHATFVWVPLSPGPESNHWFRRLEVQQPFQETVYSDVEASLKFDFLDECFVRDQCAEHDLVDFRDRHSPDGRHDIGELLTRLDAREKALAHFIRETNSKGTTRAGGSE